MNLGAGGGGGEEGESGTSRPSSPLDLLLTSSLLIVGELNYVMIVCDYLRGSERSACKLAKCALSLQTNTCKPFNNPVIHYEKH